MASRLDLDLELDLDVFTGPFDLLLSIVLREEISLLEVELGEIVASYVGVLEDQGELDLEVATEFLVLVASLLELKTRLMLPGSEDEFEEIEPEAAVEELVSRMLEYRRYRDLGQMMREHHESQRGYLYRAAPLPPDLRRIELDAAEPIYDPDQLAASLGDLLEPPPRPDLSHMRATVSFRRRLSVLRSALARRPRFDFDEVFGGEDRMTQAVTIFALLDLYAKGELVWDQTEVCGPITVRSTAQQAIARTG
ncbi:MAG: segregation/condensation protein A [Solirubrobacterales bacterium]|nr:segregation/condensation protein A [Solirubrobacterales bacterium]